MKKSKLFIILTLLCTLVFTIGVSAEEVKTGKIVGSYGYGNDKLANVDVAIYQIGTITATDDIYSYELFDVFSEEKVDFATLNSEQREEKTKKFYNIITEKNIKPLSQTLTNQSGQFTFEKLNAGVYLIKVDDLTTSAGVYRSLPALIFYPDVAADGSYVYDLSVNMKTEFVKSGDDNSGDVNDGSGSNNQNIGNNVNAPNTYDAIVMYIVVFIISIVLLTVLICYICMYNKKKAKKGKGKNEEVK